MKKIKQGLILFIILLSGCASTEVKQEAPKVPSMNDAQLKTLLIGKSMFGKYNGNTWTSTVKPDGTIDNNYDSKIRKGIYKIKNNMYCRTWNKNGNTACWTMRKRSNDYFATLVSGSSSSFKFLVK